MLRLAERDGYIERSPGGAGGFGGWSVGFCLEGLVCLDSFSCFCASSSASSFSKYAWTISQSRPSKRMRSISSCTSFSSIKAGMQ